jgi:tetratricopeptide (TPR) repeat protein/transcriptional regulator with XRE-family HTH domain
MNVAIDVDVIRAKLIDLGWTQAELAEESKLTKRTVEGLLKRRTAALDSAHQIAAALEMDVNTIIRKSASLATPSPPALLPSAPLPPTPGRLFQLPAYPADFVGRETDVCDLASRLQAGGGRVGLSALRGMGGVGKTTLAVRVAHAVKDRFPDAQLFLDLQGLSATPPTPAEVMTRLIRCFDPEARLPDAESDLLRVYRTTFADKRALVVLDNAAGEAQVKNLVTGDRTGFLITSRTALALDGVASVPVGILSPDESQALLRGIVGAKGTDAELAAVAGLCGHLPLALRVAGDFLRLKGGWSVGRYIEALEQERLRWLRVGDDPQKDVKAVLKLSADQLVRDDAALAARWHYLADWPADFAPAAAGAAWGADPDDLAVLDDLAELVDRSLVLLDERASRYRLHDLMKPTAAAVEPPPTADGPPVDLRTGKREADERAARHYANLLSDADDCYLRGGTGVTEGLTLLDQELTSIRHWQAWAARTFTAQSINSSVAELCRAYALQGAHAADLRLHPTEKIRWLEVGVSACRQLGDRCNEGTVLGNLGVAWAALGDARKAIGFYEQQIAIVREIGHGRGMGNALGNLGNAWSALGDARKALGFYEQVLAIAQETGDRRSEGSALGNLGAAWVALGDARKAIDFFEQRLAIARETGDRLGEGTAIGCLGAAWAALGNTRKAIGFYEKQLAITRETGDRRGEGLTLNNLGAAWAALGDARKALDFYEKQIAIARETGDRCGEGTALGNVGVTWAHLGDAQKAIDLFEQRLAIARETSDRRGEGTTLGNLGNAWALLGDARKAIDFFEQQLAVARETGDRRNEGNALGNLGTACADLKDARKAIGFFEQQLAIARETGDRRDEGLTLNNLGAAWGTLGDARKAIGFFEQQLAIARETGDRRGEGECSLNLAVALFSLNRRDEAIRHAEHALIILQAIESPHTETVRQTLADWHAQP